MSAVLVFDLETIPDASGLRKAWSELPDDANKMTDLELVSFVLQQREAQTGKSFLPLQFQRVIAIGCLFRAEREAGEVLQLRCLGDDASDEAKLIRDFFRIIDKYSPQLVSWNGSGFDLPVLHYRALIHGLAAPRYWDMGEDDRDFKFNNYISRYHQRHTDLMDLLSLYNGRALAPLDQVAMLCGFPGKQGMSGAQVWPAFCEGRIDDIRHYCLTDVLNTWLVWCRFQRLRGIYSGERYQSDIEMAKSFLRNQSDSRWMNFLSAWEGH
ncbi:MAG: 3'-5' exonuclease [Betaproteobacteria bacterium]|nr:3'-5' exonuclease [Betaproteobacteria bacterium]